jgi:hypothetical protein
VEEVISEVIFDPQPSTTSEGVSEEITTESTEPLSSETIPEQISGTTEGGDSGVTESEPDFPPIASELPDPDHD